MSSIERSDAVANYQRVLEAACEVFTEHGPGAEVREIADRAGVGVGTLYRHFGSKTDLLDAAAQQAGGEFVRALEDSLDPEHPLEAMSAFLVKVATLINSRGTLVSHFLRTDTGGATHVTYHRGLRRLIENGIKSGAFRTDVDVDVLVLLLAGAIIQLLGFRETGENSRPRPEDFAAGILAVFRAR